LSKAGELRHVIERAMRTVNEGAATKAAVKAKRISKPDPEYAGLLTLGSWGAGAAGSAGLYAIANRKRKKNHRTPGPLRQRNDGAEAQMGIK